MMNNLSKMLIILYFFKRIICVLNCFLGFINVQIVQMFFFSCSSLIEGSKTPKYKCEDVHLLMKTGYYATNLT